MPHDINRSRGARGDSGRAKKRAVGSGITGNRSVGIGISRDDHPGEAAVACSLDRVDDERTPCEWTDILSRHADRP
jgi:hypothetical protein